MEAETKNRELRAKLNSFEERLGSLSMSSVEESEKGKKKSGTDPCIRRERAQRRISGQ